MLGLREQQFRLISICPARFSSPNFWDCRLFHEERHPPLKPKHETTRPSKQNLGFHAKPIRNILVHLLHKLPKMQILKHI